MAASIFCLAASEKADASFHTLSRFAVGFGVTDEIFAVSVSKNKSVSKYYMAGLISMPYLGWSAGTLAGALLGQVIPEMLGNALGIAIYGMFLAIIIPTARDDARFLKVIIIATVLSCCFKWIPVLQSVSSGFVIIICAVIAALAGAFLYPVEDK